MEFIMKKPKHQKFSDCFEAYQHMKNNTRPKSRRKDGAIQTHPIIDVPDILEYEVQDECCKWLKQHRIFHDAHGCGSGDLVGAGQARYGIKDAGDIIGILPNGIHFEIECKRGRGGRLSKGQQDRMRDVRANNGVYLVIHGVTELEYYFRGLI